MSGENSIRSVEPVIGWLVGLQPLRPELSALAPGTSALKPGTSAFKPGTSALKPGATVLTLELWLKMSHNCWKLHDWQGKTTTIAVLRDSTIQRV